MKKTVFLMMSVLVMTLLTSTSFAESYRIGFVNATRVFEESPQYQSARDRLETEFSRREKELLSNQKQLKQLEEKVQRDGSVMSESEAKQP